jgi:hypothetical protein
VGRNRHQFKANFKAASITTVTDGILRSKDAKYIFTVLEAKKILRERNSGEIKIQKTAEMV